VLLQLQLLLLLPALAPLLHLLLLKSSRFMVLQPVRPCIEQTTGR
jgi:hypothetical protein